MQAEQVAVQLIHSVVDLVRLKRKWTVGLLIISQSEQCPDQSRVLFH